jgi:putative transposase
MDQGGTKPKAKKEPEVVPKEVRAYKLKLQPNKKQKEIFSNWVGCHRYTYNKVIATCNNKKDTMNCYNELKLRNRFVIKKTNKKRKEASEKEKLQKLQQIQKKREKNIKALEKAEKQKLKALEKEEKEKLKASKKKKTVSKKEPKNIPVKLTVKPKVYKHKRIRKKKLNSVNNFFNNKEWLETCPSDIRKDAVKEACTAFKSAFTNLKRKNTTHFNVRFKSKKQQLLSGWSIKFCKEHVKKVGCKLQIYSTFLPVMKVCNKKQLHKLIDNDHPEKDCEITKDRFGDYYLIVKKEIAVAPKTTSQKVVAIDPGIRKYLTTYSPDQKEAFLIASNYERTILPLLLELDNMYSLETKTHGKQLREIKSKIVKQRKKIYNMKKEAIHQISNIITNKYDIIVMPKLDVLSLSNKRTRTLKTKTVRNMLTMCHCKLFDEVKRKCFERGKTFLHVFEHYTSQTCPNCGHTHKSSSETKHCPKCLFLFDRDIVGAFNILLKAIRLQ